MAKQFIHYSRTGVHKTSARRRWPLVIVSLVLLAGLGLVVKWLEAPTHGHLIPADKTAVNSLTTANTNTGHTAPPSPASQLSSSYFRLNLPVGYSADGHQPIPANLLYVQAVTAPSADAGSIIISIAIQALPGGALSANSSYKTRLQQPSRYQLTTKTFANQPVTIAADTQSGGVVAFWPHAGYLATISATSAFDTAGGVNNSEESAVVQTLLGGWQWL